MKTIIFKTIIAMLLIISAWEAGKFVIRYEEKNSNTLGVYYGTHMDK